MFVLYINITLFVFTFSIKHCMIVYVKLFKWRKSMVKVVELTEDNESMYLDQVASLEEDVLQKMEQEQRIGQLFITG